MELEILLKQNYDELVSEECRQKTLSFIEDNQSVSGRDVSFIKELTKVARHIIRKDSSSINSYAERLYKFALEGIAKLEFGCANDLSVQSQRIFVSHLCAYAGDFALLEFCRTKDVKWAEKWFEGYKESAIRAPPDDKHMAYAWGFAGQAAIELFIETDDEKWALEWYACCKEAGFLCKDFDKKHSAISQNKAAQAARYLFDMTGNLEWLIEEADLLISAGETVRDVDPVYSSMKFCSASSIFKHIFYETKDYLWIVRSYTAKQKAAATLQEVNPDQAAKIWSFSGDVAKTLYSCTNDVRWAVLWFEANRKAVNLFVKTNPVQASYTYGFMGDAARQVFYKTKKEFWVRVWYHSELSSAEGLESVNRKASFYNYLDSSQAASELFEYTKDVEWAETGLTMANRAYRIASNELSIKYEHALSAIRKGASIADRIYDITHDFKFLQQRFDYINECIKFANKRKQPVTDFYGIAAHTLGKIYSATMNGEYQKMAAWYRKMKEEVREKEAFKS